MRAIVQHGYGAPAQVLELRDDVDKPEVADVGVLVRVHASSLNSGDWRRVLADPFLVRLMEGLRRPKTRLLGGDAAGVVEAVGKDVTDISVGDEVYGLRTGAYGEYVSGQSFVSKPHNLTFEEAAAVPVAGCTALQAVRDRGNVRPGHKVLINGAGGGVGTFAVQIAKAFGAEVTATTSTGNIDLVRSIGADHVIDYTHEDFTKQGRRYDVIIDCGGKPSIAAFRRALAADGTLVLVAAGKGAFGALGRFSGSQVRRRVLKQPVVTFIASGPYKENLLALKELIEAGKVKPVIDRTYPLSEIADAVAYAATERARGKVVISISGAGEPAE
ncbi:NAD(P)-dependent alcohol dehydrogenase [soil metagenome]